MKQNYFFKKSFFFYLYLLLAIIFIVIVFASIRHYIFDDFLVFEVDQKEKRLLKFKAEDIDDYQKNDLPFISSKKMTMDNLDGYYDEIFQQYKSHEAVVSGDRAKNAKEKFGSGESSSFSYEQWKQEILTLDQETSAQIIEGLAESFVVKKSINQSNVTEGLSSNPLQIKNSVQEKQLEVKFSEARKKLKTFYNERFFYNYKHTAEARKLFSKKFFSTSPEPSYEDGVNSLEDLKNLELIMDKKKYYRFEIIRANLIASKSIKINDLRVYVVRNGKLISNVSGEYETKFYYEDSIIFTSLSLGYNPREAAYWVVVRSKSNPKWEGLSTRFDIVHSQLPSVKSGFSVVNMEYVISIENKEVIDPNGQKKDYKAIVDWLIYTDVDALWMLAAQTNGWHSSISPNNPWVPDALKNLDLLGPVVKKKGLLLGAYVMSFYTPGDGKKLVNYQPSLGYDLNTNRLYASKHVSLVDKNRIKHITQVAKRFQKNENVDFIGFDFIRTGRADGYEMGPLVVRDMGIPTPVGYDRFTNVEKVKWFARLVKNPNNQSAIKKWRWWRAHRVASIINEVIREAKIDKPVWVFTLGWSWGHQHGQDPYMFFDAGVFIDAVMLYEASKEMFRNMMHMWPRYMFPSGNNLMIGNSTDVRLLDSIFPNPAVEYVYRSKVGYRRVYRNGLAKGIFMHDISRALWSRHRGLDVSEWSIVHGSVTSNYRRELGLIPYEGSVVFNEDKITGTIVVKNNGKTTIPSVHLSFSPTPAWKKVTDNAPEVFSLKPGETKSFTFKAELNKGYKNKENILGYYLDSPFFRRYFFFTYQVDSKKLRTYLNYSN